MARKAKHNWAKLFKEFCQGGFASVAAFARKKKLNENQVRDEFRKLNGSRSKIVRDANRESTENTTEQQATENQQKTPPVSGRMPDENGLTAQQKFFVMEYLLDFNAKRAAISAGYSKKTAKYIGWELIRKPAIQKKIQEETERDVERLGLNRWRQLLEYMRIAYANVGEYVTFGQREVPVMGPFGPVYEGKGKDKKPVTRIVNYVDFIHSDEVDSTLIKEVKQGKDGVSIKLHDKMKALDKLDKYLDLLPDEHKRRIENERLAIEKERLSLEKAKIMGTPDDTEDDGFIDALQGKAGEAWDEYSEETEE